MKEEIMITELDYVRLCDLVHKVKNTKTAEMKNLVVLGSEIKRAKRVDSKKITSEYITMNSVIEVTDMDTNKILNLKLVYPRDADFKKGHISILSPLGSALIGYKVGDTISFEVPKGVKEIKINRILFQPEANGQYDV